MDQIRTGQFIAEQRKKQSLTQRQLADRLGISDKTISKWETGNGLPEVSLMVPLCNELGITVNELLSGERIPEAGYKDKAEDNIVALMKSQYRAMNAAVLFSVFLSFFVVFTGVCLSLRIRSTGWAGSALFDFDAESFAAEILMYIVAALLFFLLETLLLRKAESRWVIALPVFLSAAAYLFCLFTALSGTGSPSVLAENRYFAMYLSMPVTGAFVGSVLAFLPQKLLKP
ncbi:MAG: helix-turn-helix transcriptional regulator [Solobacterium sp.]|nr:helix-turn-helix transcriptional regulator [Solobacterium sp.]